MAKEKIALSIITNWGCKHHCPFCLCKGIIPEPDIDYQALESVNLPKFTRISISGGGEPLNDIPKLTTLITFLQDHSNAAISVHTRSKQLSVLEKLKVDKLAYSLWDMDDERLNLVIHTRIPQKRVVYVDSGLVPFGKWYAWLKEKWEGPITYKPLKGSTKQQWLDLPEDVFYLPSGDYNLYFYRDKVYTNWDKIPLPIGK